MFLRASFYRYYLIKIPHYKSKPQTKEPNLQNAHHSRLPNDPKYLRNKNHVYADQNQLIEDGRSLFNDLFFPIVKEIYMEDYARYQPKKDKRSEYCTHRIAHCDLVRYNFRNRSSRNDRLIELTLFANSLGVE